MYDEDESSDQASGGSEGGYASSQSVRYLACLPVGRCACWRPARAVQCQGVAPPAPQQRAATRDPARGSQEGGESGVEATGGKAEGEGVRKGPKKAAGKNEYDYDDEWLDDEGELGQSLLGLTSLLSLLGLLARAASPCCRAARRAGGDL